MLGTLHIVVTRVLPERFVLIQPCLKKQKEQRTHVVKKSNFYEKI
jgi:hypothetical protein